MDKRQVFMIYFLKSQVDLKLPFLHFQLTPFVHVSNDGNSKIIPYPPFRAPKANLAASFGEINFKMGDFSAERVTFEFFHFVDYHIFTNDLLSQNVIASN